MWGTRMLKADTTTIFSVALTKRATAVMALRQGGILVPQGPAASWVDGGPHALV